MTQRVAFKLNSRQVHTSFVKALQLSERKGVKINESMLRKIFAEAADDQVLREVISYYISRARQGAANAKPFLNRMASEEFNKNNGTRSKVIATFRNLALKGDSFGLEGLIIATKDSVADNRGLALMGLTDLRDARVASYKGLYSTLQATMNPDFIKNIVLTAKTDAVLSFGIDFLASSAKKGDVKSKIALAQLALEKLTKNSKLREMAVYELSELALTDKSTRLDGLIEALHDSDKEVRYRAICGLSKLAEKGDARTLLGIVIGLGDSYDAVRTYSSNSVGYLAKFENPQVKSVLNRLALEKINKNNLSRALILKKFYYLADEGSSFGLRGLLVGVRDSNSDNRYNSLSGLRELARRGVERALPGLVEGMKDSEQSNRSIALEGIRELARRDNAQARKALEELKE